VHDEFYDILDRMREVHAKKAADYGSNDDPLKNFRAAVPIGIPAWMYAYARVLEKQVRIQSFIEKGHLVCEDMDESLIDIANLAILTLQLFRQENHDAPKVP
jgi:hypothetical protein